MPNRYSLQMISLGKAEDFDAYINEPGQKVLVDFYAGWCEPCKWLDEILYEIGNDMPDEILILKIDIETFPELKDRFEVKSVPVLALFIDGKIAWRMNGFASGPELIKIISSFV